MNFQQNPLVSGTLPDSLQNLTSLQQFNCVYCSLSGQLPEWIGERWTELNELGLTQNKLSGSLPESMAMMTSMFLLALDDNFFGGTLDALQRLASLEAVYLENNNFSGMVDGTFFADAENLTRLVISDNILSGSVPVHLFGLDRMTTMDLHDNRLTVFEDSIPPSSLKLLTIHGNPIEGEFPSSTISNLAALTHLDLTSTTFTGEMPATIGTLMNLTYLFMADTLFEPGPIPDSYQFLSKMVDLSLKKSSRDGPIPEWIAKLNELVLLDLHTNSLTGTIPSDIGDMQSLEFLLLNRNELTGSIPSSMSSMSNLRKCMYIPVHFFTCSFPALTHSPVLSEIVFLEGNSLSGSMDPVCAPSLLAAVADCGGIVPEVECLCCNLCCSDADPGCNGGMDFLAQFDPQWETNFDRNGVYVFTEDFDIISSPSSRGNNMQPNDILENFDMISSRGRIPSQQNDILETGWV